MPGRKLPSKAYEQHGFAINLMQHLVIPTFVIDAECRVIIWNKACERLTGVLASDVVGTNEHWRAFYDVPRPCLADVLAMDWLDRLDEFYVHTHVVPSELSQGLRVENWCVMPRIGSQLYLAIDAGPIYDDEGNLLAVVETLRDMTEHKRAQIALQQLATKDGLTSLANRRTFDENLQIEWQRALRHGTCLSLIMADVDYFKRYNDHYGHLGGDECLKAVSYTIEQNLCRASDMAARYGGEEFAIILPGTEPEGARLVAQRICDALYALKIPHAGAEDIGVISISMGVASIVPDMDAFPEDLIAGADKALYEAKRNGRNQVVAAPSKTNT